MKHNSICFFVILIIVTTLSSCSLTKHHDARDKYAGEYKLHSEYHTINFADPDDIYNSEDRHVYGEDDSNSLIVLRSPFDSVSLMLVLVEPFNFELRERTIETNNDIKRRNRENIYGVYEDTVPLSEPYQGKWTIIARYEGYVKDGELFIDDYDHTEWLFEYEITENTRFDSIYFNNDTLKFKQITFNKMPRGMGDYTVIYKTTGVKVDEW